MTDETTPESPESVDVLGLHLTCREIGGGNISLRTIAMGMVPIIILEPTEDADGKQVIDIDSSGMDRETLADLFGWLSEVLRNGEMTEVTPEGFDPVDLAEGLAEMEALEAEIAESTPDDE